MVKTIRVRITPTEGPLVPLGPWFATAIMTARTPDGTIKKLNEAAVRKHIDATYAVATEEEYQEYYKNRRAAIAHPGATQDTIKAALAKERAAKADER